MKFLQRRQYCTNCDKQTSFLQLTNKKSVQKQLQCPFCKNDVVSFWEEQNKMHVIPLTIGFSFFISAVIFNVWRFFAPERGVETRDYILTAVYIVLTVIIVVYATRNRKKPEPQETSDLTINKLSTYRKQYLYIVGLILIVQLLTAVIDYFLIYHFR